MLKAKLDADKRQKRALARKEAEEAEKLAAKLQPLHFSTNTPGRLSIGRPQTQPVQKTVPNDSPQLRDGAVTLTKSTTDSSRKDRKTAPPPSIRRTPGKQYQRVSPAAYVDVYLNGGKYDPPSDSLMEEVSRQRAREGAVRRVGFFEAGFCGIGKSPLGKFGKRFHKTTAPLSVEQIAKYREGGVRRPLLLDG